MCTAVDANGVPVYGEDFFTKGRAAELHVTERADGRADGRALRAVWRATKLKPKLVYHLLSAGHNALARDVREYLFSCAKALEQNKQAAIKYVDERVQAERESMEERAELIEVLEQKGLPTGDAIHVALAADKIVTHPAMLRNGKHADGNG